MFYNKAVICAPLGQHIQLQYSILLGSIYFLILIPTLLVRLHWYMFLDPPQGVGSEILVSCILLYMKQAVKLLDTDGIHLSYCL